MVISSGIGSIRHVLCFSLLGLSLSACSSIGSLGSEHFTLEGELPANFSLKAQAHYAATDLNCAVGRQAKSFETAFQKDAQQYRFKIPVSYRAGLCEVRLSRVGLFIHGRYGEQDWQQAYDNGGIEIVEKLPEGAPDFPENGALIKTAECSWWFQLSKAKSRLGQIEKILNCRGAGAFIEQDAVSERNISGKIIRLVIRENTKEEPAKDNTWVEFPEGWKPCLPKKGWPNCQKPPVFQSFKMNGRVCTIYPNCRE